MEDAQQSRRSVGGERGLVVCLQPFLQVQHYASPHAFRSALVRLLDAIPEAYSKHSHHHRRYHHGGRGTEEEGGRRPTEVDVPRAQLVVFPEMVGTWLVATNELPDGFAGSSTEGMQHIIMRHLWQFLVELVHSFWNDHWRYGMMAHVKRAIFRMKAGDMFELYRTTFSDLAREYNIWIVAGSILLPRVEWIESSEENGIGEGRLWRRLETSLSSTGLYNVSLSFAPDGSVCNVTHKRFLDGKEMEFVDSAPLTAINSFASPFGEVAVAICADSWYPQTYSRLKDLGADIVCVPAYVTPGTTWNEPWGGYSGRSCYFPVDTDSDDIRQLSEAEAWSKYALEGRISDSGAKLGVCSYLMGQMWEMTGGGESIIVSGEGEVLAQAHEGVEQILVHEVELIY